MGDAVEMVFGYLFHRRDCLAVREPAPEGALARLCEGRAAGGGEVEGEGAPGCFASGVVSCFLPKFPLYEYYQSSREGRRVDRAGIPLPVPLKPVFILGTESSLPFLQ